jgi:hypothetical protein
MNNRAYQCRWRKYNEWTVPWRFMRHAFPHKISPPHHNISKERGYWFFKYLIYRCNVLVSFLHFYFYFLVFSLHPFFKSTFVSLLNEMESNEWKQGPYGTRIIYVIFRVKSTKTTMTKIRQITSTDRYPNQKCLNLEKLDVHNDILTCMSAITEESGSKCKAPACRHHATKAHIRREEGKTLCILDLCTRRKWFGSRSDCFTHAKDSRLPLDNRLSAVHTLVLPHGGGGPITVLGDDGSRTRTAPVGTVQMEVVRRSLGVGRMR